MMRRVAHVGYAHSRSAACGRLRSDGGFTLGEVMATVVLVGLLTLAIAAGIGVAVNVYGEIRGHSESKACSTTPSRPSPTSCGSPMM